MTGDNNPAIYQLKLLGSEEIGYTGVQLSINGRNVTTFSFATRYYDDDIWRLVTGDALIRSVSLDSDDYTVD